jgi:hypothetical protein
MKTSICARLYVFRLPNTPSRPPKKAVLPSSQLEFDFGASFRTWVTPFFLREPIHVLGLTKFAEKALTDNGKKLLSDLVGTDLRALIFLKGMGQGHVQEIQEKLHAALAGKDPSKAFQIDFAAWLRALFAEAPTKKIYVLLEAYQLQELVPITAAESVEIRRLSEEQRREWKENALATVNKDLFQDDLKNIVEAFLKPWMNKRLGLVREWELYERLEQVSDDPEKSPRVLKLLEESLGQRLFLFIPFLESPEGGLLCAERWQLQAYKRVQRCACTYFYAPQVRYTLSHLVDLIERELLRTWEGYPSGFVEKVLRLSQSFEVQRTLHGEITVQKRFFTGQAG